MTDTNRKLRVTIKSADVAFKPVTVPRTDDVVQPPAVTVSRTPCPFVYSKGKQCTGHVVRIEAYKADVRWHVNDDGSWSLGMIEPRSHYHLFCSEKDNHAGWGQSDNEQMKFWYGDLPDELKAAISRPTG